VSSVESEATETASGGDERHFPDRAFVAVHQPTKDPATNLEIAATLTRFPAIVIDQHTDSDQQEDPSWDSERTIKNSDQISRGSEGEEGEVDWNAGV